MTGKYESVVQMDVENGDVTHTMLVDDSGSNTHMDVENGDVSNTMLVDDSSPNTQTCCQKSWKWLLIIVALLVASNIGLVVGLVKCSTGKPHTNNPNNCSTLEQADYRKQQLLPGGQYKGACIYNTSRELLEKLEQDPFGDLCRPDSPTCQQGLSEHACKSCGDKKVKFPSFCFCDKKAHCNQIDGEMPFDSQQNSDCSDCLGNFSRTLLFSTRGTCTCPNGPFQPLKCDCYQGYKGFMCSSIEKRYCTPTANKPQIPHCKDSNEESCHLNQDGKYYLCKLFQFDDTDQNKGGQRLGVRYC